jgi:hypothetical protein
MKYLKRIWESNNNLEIERICKKYRISNYSINSDGTVDVMGSVELDGKKFYDKFNKIDYKIKNDFILDEIPINFGVVTGNFNMRGNNIKSLKGLPKTIGGSLYLYDNAIESLEGSPDTVDRMLLDGNKLNNLEGSPERINGDFSVGDNLLTTFLGGPQFVGGYYSFINNPIRDFSGFPEGHTGNIFMRNTPISSVVKLIVNQDRSLGFSIEQHAPKIGNLIDVINDYDLIIDGKYIQWDVLNFISEMMNRYQWIMKPNKDDLIGNEWGYEFI